MSSLAQAVIAVLRERRESIATCESITGGAIAATLTDIPGASAVFRGGLITYASDLKASLAGVDAELIANQGVINEETARQMARGAVERCGSNWAVATTGVAGPDQQDGADVGTLFLALAGAKRVVSREFRLSGSRPDIRNQSVRLALVLILEELNRE